ncbi:unnamed protein product [Discula destructiva]
MGSVTPQSDEYPPKVNLARDIYRPFPPLPASLPPPAETNAPALITNALGSLTAALQAGDVTQLKACFLASQAYWRDILALTWHLRTFNDGLGIAPSLLALARQRGWDGRVEIDTKNLADVTVSPELRWIEALFTFETASPAAECGGRVVLLPEEGQGGVVRWKIWSLSTWAEGLKEFPEDVDGLRAPGRDLAAEETIETDVFVLGGGNSGILLSARLKALGVDSVIVDRNSQPGDNWALRYDCLRFHIGRHNVETPYLRYDDNLPVILTRTDLADHMKNYVATFHLNMLNSSSVQESSFNQTTRTWNFKIRTPFGTKVVKSKHLVQSTGIGGQCGYVPDIPGAMDFKGVNIHSEQYKNPRTLSDKGAKSVIIVGSANSAFDILEDCAAAGLQTTVVARSPTYIFPWKYSLAPEGLGVYETLGADLADRLQMTGPASIGGQLVRGLHQKLAEKEPSRYAPLAAAGFPVYDSCEGRGDLLHHLMERAGGHFNDIGEGIEMIISGKVAVKGSVEPVVYTPTGLKFSDGSTVDADAIVWCTGFRDKDRAVTANVLGGKTFVVEETGEGDEILSPQDVAARRDTIWGVDKEGELRGVFKRHLRMDNYWIIGGTAAHHRFYSKPIALQIKADLERILPEAYVAAPVAV